MTPLTIFLSPAGDISLLFLFGADGAPGADEGGLLEGTEE